MTIEERILKVLEQSRPYLQQDGGDIEFVRYENAQGIAVLRFVGACRTCAMNTMTLRAGIERALRLEIPEIRRVEAE